MPKPRRNYLPDTTIESKLSNVFKVGVTRYNMKRRQVSKKQKVLSNLYKKCKSTGNLTFDTNMIKQECDRLNFKNQFDITKIDRINLLPDILITDNVFVLHLGQGKHQFIPDIEIAYHKFETNSDNIKHNWNYCPSALDNIDGSASNMLFVAYNQRIIHNFLYGNDMALPMVYGSHKTTMTTDYKIGNKRIKSDSVQIEIDLTLEYKNTITVFKANRGRVNNFNVFQLLNPFCYYKDKNQLSRYSINCCYLLSDAHTLRFYLYTFTDPHRPNSIKLDRTAEYVLVEK